MSGPFKVSLVFSDRTDLKTVEKLVKDTEVNVLCGVIGRVFRNKNREFFVVVSEESDAKKLIDIMVDKNLGNGTFSPSGDPIIDI